MSAKIQLNIWHVAKYLGWDWAGIVGALPGVKTVAKHILMLDLDSGDQHGHSVQHPQSTQEC